MAERGAPQDATVGELAVQLTEQTSRLVHDEVELAARGPQVVMNTRNGASNGAVAVQDLEPIFQSKEVRQIYSYLVQQNGRKAMSEAEKQRDRLLDQLARQAQEVVQSSVQRLH